MTIRSRLEELSNMISLRSTVYSEYFFMLMTNNNINSVRNGIRFLVFYYFSEVTLQHMASRTHLFKPVVALLSFCIHAAIFTYTVNVRKPLTMIRISSVLVMLSMGYTLMIATDRKDLMETHYALPICMILMMFTVFKQKFLITMIMSVIYCMIFSSGASYRLHDQDDHHNVTDAHARALSVIRLPEMAHLENKLAVLIGQMFLFILIILTGVYLRIINSIRRKSAFLKLAQYAEAKMKMKSAVQVQIYWIEAIMPKAVKDEFLKKIGHRDMVNLIYCKNFDNVSILFADIVGFTEMSSNKSAQTLVYLLNDLYNRFDEYGRVMNCEKIGTLGDCYYCVSGCPVARPDHASCCVEMGLGMCKMILLFNSKHRENVNMRVGIHSGRVIAAIIGSHRFRFDVFSNDVLIANNLESTGKAGKVHISEETYKLVRHAYVFEDGDELQIKREEGHGIAGLFLKTVNIKTYFIATDQMSNVSNVDSNMYTSNKGSVGNPGFQVTVNENELLQQKNDMMKHHLDLIRTLQRDPEKPVEFFQKPPINKLTLRFEDQEVEAHFLSHCTDQVRHIDVDSYKFVILIDSLACVFYCTVVVVASAIMSLIPSEIITKIALLYGSGIVIALIAAWISTTYKSLIKNSVLRSLFTKLSHPISRLLFSVYISSLPCIMVLYMYQEDQMHKEYSYTIAYFTACLFSLIGNCLFSSSYSLIKYMSTILCVSAQIYTIFYPFGHIKASKVASYHDCESFMVNHMVFNKFLFKWTYSFQLMFICYLMCYLARENEKNSRIHFYASREAEIRNDEAKRARKVAESLLYNIIPKHVFAQITRSKTDDKAESSFNYAHAIANAGVVFACISNFFSDYYREDYKGGESSLKLLHCIICRFDNLFRKPMYNHLEKIKTINDCYMLASGLNTTVDVKSDDHLVKLMYFAMEMLYQLNLFNEENIIGTSVFKMKVGYNFGPVTAGIIGTSKPLYDIWGDTVNVSSRMYSTAPAGSIQVSEEVSKKLQRFFEFQYRGLVKIKGKGEMLTYLLVGPKQVKKLTKQASSDSFFEALQKAKL